ncbi:hypothetical protein [Actinomadura atramentaria]|uniref:hypothetical protein n=1 Tax=Actinomadura atramentaria TaxID=1990 RepID=UPI00037B1C39|nr:hypothetical protein [Actinomadura atramentaria]
MNGVLRKPGFWIVVIIAGIVLINLLSKLGSDGSDRGGQAVVFESPDTTRLVERATQAKNAQGVCYGWIVDSGVHSDDTSSFADPSGADDAALHQTDVEYGSNLGPSTDPRREPAQCPRWAVVVATYDYSSVDEEWTSASVRVVDNIGLAGRLPADFPANLGITRTDLISEDGVARVADTISALPLAAAQAGLAPAVPLDSGQNTTATGDRISGAGDAGKYVPAAIGTVLVLAGLTWIAVAAVRSRRNTE